VAEQLKYEGDIRELQTTLKFLKERIEFLSGEIGKTSDKSSSDYKELNDKITEVYKVKKLSNRERIIIVIMVASISINFLQYLFPNNQVPINPDISEISTQDSGNDSKDVNSDTPKTSSQDSENDSKNKVLK